MESIRTPSPPTDAMLPKETPRGADGDIDGLEPALSDVLTPSKQDGTPPGTLRKPIKFTYGSSNSLSSLPLPQAAPIDFRASGSSRAVASPPASPAALREQTSNASEKFDGVSFEEDPFRLSARDLDLREVIGTGAFGRVHTAKWRNTPVAVKVLFHDCSRDDVDMFHKEIKLMARLHHPNIAQFLGYAKLGPDELVLVLELFENGSLEQYVPKERPGVRTTLEFCRDMARAVEYLHGREPHITVHRDLKPPNFLVCKCLRIKLGDFGIARNLNSPRARLDASGGGIPRVSSSSKLSSPGGKTHFPASAKEARAAAGDLDSSRGPFFPGSAKEARAAAGDLDSSRGPLDITGSEYELTTECGTARFMAPEVASPAPDVARRKYREQADIFSLGLVFYYVWERKLPSVKGALNVDEHRAAINSGARPAFSRTPKAIRALIERMWAFNPTDRASAASVSSFLEACTVKPSLTGLGVKAP